MLGQDILRAAGRARHEVLPLSHDELDIVDQSAVYAALRAAVAGWREDGDEQAAIVNCAAFTDVDGAESESAAAHAVNADGAGSLARAAADEGLPLLHVSSDYVFSGEPQLSADGRPRPYVESDEPAPRSAYGQSKLAGERQVLAASPGHVVVRSSWLFGAHGANFAATMLRLGGEREYVEVVDDQVGSPTWTGHLAAALVGLLERGVSGLVHLAGGGEVSWNGFAREIFRQAELACEVRATSTSAIGRPAPRPAYSALASERGDVIPLPPWQDGLAGFLAARAGMMRA
jgi:dTDP-4-dehydrorhamnose reductase